MGEKSVAEAISMMFAGAATGMVVNSKDEYFPITLDEWLALPLRPGLDVGIHTSKMVVREPRIIVAVNYDKMPKRRPKFTLKNIAATYGNRCAYTDKLLDPDEFSKDHVLPLSRGGLDVPENVVLADKKINNFKGARTPKECGLRTPKIRRLIVPGIKPTHSDHELFLK